MFTPMARLLLVDLDGQDPVAPRGRLPSIATGVCLPLPPRISIAVQLRGYGAFQHLGGALQGAFGNRRAVQHCRQLLLPGGIVKGVDGRNDATVPLALRDLEMQIPEGRDLRQMGDHPPLVIPRQRPERLTDDLTGSPTDTDVDLVKNQ